MKKPKTLLTIIIILAYVSPLIVVILFRDKPFFESFFSFAIGFIGMLTVAYFGKLIEIIKSIYKSESDDFEKLNLKLKIIWAVFCVLTSVLILYYSFNYTPNLGYNAFFILFGIFLMIQGNYQSVLPKKMGLQNSMTATYGDTYGDTFYKKSQKLTGKFEFYFGLLVVIIFLILPNTKQVAVGGIFGIFILYYLGSWVIIYKNTQIIAESEAKNKTS
ncbi:hypothetical protein VB796_11720 [Arcicella sp. LKC2W]|uniref:hypothetical protein n=1 Tax=Arcicella sp. LKC2W TaxID=2984198 RepID=UPI002B1EAEB6|nr:hypothetical protein [Arcicella sp. LKC2W]MEA5459715.1 hypothetical protein [Arcicella sp. LKC2W]